MGLADELRKKRRFPSLPWRTFRNIIVVAGVLMLMIFLATPKFGHAKNPKLRATQADIVYLQDALNAFKTDTGRYPKTMEGLQILVEADLPNWHGPYIEKIPRDKWGNPYLYFQPGTNGKPFELMSYGPDGKPGGGDDISSPVKVGD